MKRVSNTLNGALSGLTACGAITEREANAYRYQLTAGDRRGACDDLAARFGLAEVDGRWTWFRPLRVRFANAANTARP